MNLETNILIAGKTGVGKSEFINYVYGQNVRESGAGKPVTEVGLHEETIILEGLTVNLFDSWGLEANKAKEWTKEILDEVKKRSESNNIKDWFHTIFYCFSAQSARIEEFEKNDILKKLIQEGNKIIIIFTHCDIKGVEAKIEGMKKSLYEIGIDEDNIICVSSKGKKLLNGSYKEPFGKDEVVEAIRKNLRKSLSTKLIKKYTKITNESFNKWRSYCLSEIDKEVSVFNTIYIKEKLISSQLINLNIIKSEISKQCTNITNEYYNYYTALEQNFCLAIYNSSYTNFKSNFNTNDSQYEYIPTTLLDNFISLLYPYNIIIGLITGSKNKIKSTLISKVNETYNELISEIPNMILEFIENSPIDESTNLEFKTLKKLYFEYQEKTKKILNTTPKEISQISLHLDSYNEIYPNDFSTLSIADKLKYILETVTKMNYDDIQITLFGQTISE